MAYDQNTVPALYKKLLGLYPQAFKEQLAESMEQSLNDLFNEQKQWTSLLIDQLPCFLGVPNCD